MADLHVTVAGVDFSNPLIAASGTFGFGREYNEFYPLSTLGGISSKGIKSVWAILRRELQKPRVVCSMQSVCKIPEQTILLNMICLG